MKKTFRFLLKFEAADGTPHIAEFGNLEECQSFQKDLDAEGLPNKLVNVKELKAALYNKVSYLDLR